VSPVSELLKDFDEAVKIGTLDPDALKLAKDRLATFGVILAPLDHAQVIKNHLKANDERYRGNAKVYETLVVPAINNIKKYTLKRLSDAQQESELKESTLINADGLKEWCEDAKPGQEGDNHSRAESENKTSTDYGSVEDAVSLLSDADVHTLEQMANDPSWSKEEVREAKLSATVAYFRKPALEDFLDQVRSLRSDTSAQTTGGSTQPSA
jgi:hypothetical protein